MKGTIPKHIVSHALECSGCYFFRDDDDDIYYCDLDHPGWSWLEI